MTHQPLACPVCHRTATTRLLEKFTLTAELRGTAREMNAVGAFKCEEGGHIFFVRFADIKWLESAAPVPAQKPTEATSTVSHPFPTLR
jgi:hypothetical protein